MPKISIEELNRHFTGDGANYPIYNETVCEYKKLMVHADGVFPKELIEKRRPSESDEIVQYRKDTYEPITMLPLSKAIGSLNKIRRSEDWCLNFPKDKVPAKIPENETLEEYCTKYVPGFVSIEDWAFGILLKQNIIDSNAVIAVVPVAAIDPTEFIKPVPILFNSDQVIYFDDMKKYCVLKSKRKVNYFDTNQQYVAGDRFYYIDDTEVIIYDLGKDGYAPVFEIKNVTGQMPAWKVKGEVFKQFDNMPINRSRFHAMVPFLNKAAAGDSDLEGSKIQHLYPLFWYYQNKECGNCNGNGKVKTSEDSEPTTCTSCGGGGKVKFSPFAHIEVSTTELGKLQAPSPPAGYIQRDTAILELQEKTVEKNNYKALAAINMQFLDQTPLSISGDAKQVDREELNNTVYSIAEDIIFSIARTIYFINEWRYSYLIPDQATRQAMLPNIPIPQNYDLLPEDYLMKEVTDARTGKVNPLLIATLEQQLAAKKFYNHPDLAANIKLYFDLDPLPGMSVDEKMSLISNKAITQEDFVISSYMASFIKRAVREDKDFAKKDYQAQMDLLIKYAKEKIAANDSAQQMIDAQKQKVIDEQNAAAAAAAASSGKAA